MESIVRDCGSSGRTFKSASDLRRAGLRSGIREAARNALAWEDIDDDEDTKKRIDEAQIKASGAEPEERTAGTERSIFPRLPPLLPAGKGQRAAPIDLGQITSSATPSGSIVELFLRELQRCEEITDGISP